MELPDIVASTYAIAPEITLIITGLLLIVIDPVTKKRNDLYWLALLGILISFALNLSRFSESSTAFSGALSLILERPNQIHKGVMVKCLCPATDPVD